jgi:hypothetical protein
LRGCLGGLLGFEENRWVLSCVLLLNIINVGSCWRLGLSWCIAICLDIIVKEGMANQGSKSKKSIDQSQLNFSE